jgi:hypothetical protein
MAHITAPPRDGQKTAYILAGWAKCGLGPFDPDRVLQHIPKPRAELTIPNADEASVRSCPQDEVLQTPVTPVSAEALMSLQKFVIKKYAHMLDETSKWSAPPEAY